MTTEFQFPIYLDYAASTPLDERVAHAMVPFLFDKNSLGNSSSNSHIYGRAAHNAIEEARSSVAELISASENQIIWTSGATESNNLVIQGVIKACRRQAKHIITVTTEHKSILDPCRELEQEGVRVTYLRPSKNGLIDLTILEDAIAEDTVLISIMHINNETGVIQNIAEIGKIAASKNVLFHVDAAQSIGKLPIDVKSSLVDFISLSSHKIYGPKGIGALFIRDRHRIGLKPLMMGGGQEYGLRSGTLPTHQIVGMGIAYQIAKQEMKNDLVKIQKLQSILLSELHEIDEIYINGDISVSYPGIVNVGFNYVDNKKLLIDLDNIALSAGSACTSSTLESSYVLRAMGVETQIARGSLRISYGKFTTENEIHYASKSITNSVKKLRNASPMWKMLKESETGNTP